MAPTALCSVPLIDLEDFPGQSRKLIEACEEWGCFRLTNHHRILPVQLAAEMKAVVRSLLDLPAAVKRRNVDAIPGSGYMAPSPVNPNYEALGLFDIASHEAVDAFCDQLEASPHQRETIKMYAKAYNFTPETLGSSGVQVHTDSGFLTILQDDEKVGGLEVMDKSGQFVALEPLPGTLLVNLGDVATVWSNGKFCNVKHRVLCKQAALRFSIASFLLGPMAAPVEAPPELVDSAHPRLYAPLNYEDYRKLRLSNNMHAGEALSLVRISP
ncbi:hypothetical protein NMG60_11007683 [Bertholletia excelsa]